MQRKKNRAVRNSRRFAPAIKSSNQLQLNPDGLRFAECALNPFGVDHPLGLKSVGARIPDNNNRGVPVTLSASTNFLGSTATSGVIELRHPALDSAAIIRVHYGTDATVISNTPTATATATAFEATVVDALIDGTYSDPPYRLVSAALRVTATSPPDDTSGVLRAAQTDGTCQTAAAAWNAYGSLMDRMIGTTNTASVGMQVRTSYDGSFPEYHSAPATIYTLVGGYGLRPVISFSGLAAATILRIEAVIHCEVMLNSYELPFSVPSLQPQDNLIQLIALINSAPSVVTGNSFKSFVAALKKVGKGALKFIAANPVLIGKAAATLLG